MSQPQRGPLFHSICGVGKSKFEFKAKTQLLVKNVEEIIDQCNKRVAECDSVAEKLKSEYDSIIAEAHANSDKIVSEAKAKATLIHTKATDTIAQANSEAAGIRDKAMKEVAAWEAEKTRLAHTKEFGKVVNLNVGGQKVSTSLSTLCRFPDSMLGAMFSGRHEVPLDEEGRYFIDRDGTHFRHILNFLRNPENFRVNLSSNELKELKVECEYYLLLDVMFPFTPAAPVTINTNMGTVTVTQNHEGVWLVNDKPLKVCRHCFAAEMELQPGHHRYAHNAAHYCMIPSFTNGVTKRELNDEQPQPHTCLSCRQIKL